MSAAPTSDQQSTSLALSCIPDSGGRPPHSSLKCKESRKEGSESGWGKSTVQPCRSSQNFQRQRIRCSRPFSLKSPLKGIEEKGGKRQQCDFTRQAEARVGLSWRSPGLQGPQPRSVRLGDLSAGARQAVPQQPCSGAWPAGGQLQREPPACSGVKEPRPSPGGQEAAQATQHGQKHGLQRRGNGGPVEGPRGASGLPGNPSCQQQSSVEAAPQLPGDKCQVLKQTGLCI